MSRILQRITDWPERAAQASWCINQLAEHCHISLATLERHFHKTTGGCPRAWLNNERQRQAGELLGDNASVKETASLLNYNSQQHFSLAFKKHHDYSPNQHRKRLADVERRRKSKAEGRAAKVPRRRH